MKRSAGARCDERRLYVTTRTPPCFRIKASEGSSRRDLTDGHAALPDRMRVYGLRPTIPHEGVEWESHRSVGQLGMGPLRSCPGAGAFPGKGAAQRGGEVGRYAQKDHLCGSHRNCTSWSLLGAVRQIPPSARHNNNLGQQALPGGSNCA